jgi:hypothetical protein
MPAVSPEALSLHRRAILADGHCDTVLNLERQSRTLGERSEKGHIDLPRRSRVASPPRSWPRLSRMPTAQHGLSAAPCSC